MWQSSNIIQSKRQTRLEPSADPRTTPLSATPDPSTYPYLSRPTIFTPSKHPRIEPRVTALRMKGAQTGWLNDRLVHLKDLRTITVSERRVEMWNECGCFAIDFWGYKSVLGLSWKRRAGACTRGLQVIVDSTHSNSVSRPIETTTPDLVSFADPENWG